MFHPVLTISGAMRSTTIDETRVLRPAATLSRQDAADLLAELTRQDVAVGGVWNATTTLWQRFDRPWDGRCGQRGTSLHVGSIAVSFPLDEAEAPSCVTLYRATLTVAGLTLGWTASALCDDALGAVGRSLADFPRQRTHSSYVVQLP
jgi:hypothetical protein